MADKTLLEALKSLITISKDIPSEDLENIKDVTDLYNGDMHKVPSRKEVVVGPSESSDGENAFKMVPQYSSPAKQTKLVEEYNTFSSMLEGMTKAIKALQDGQKTIAEAFVAKAAEPEAPAADTFLGKAELRLKKAATALRKADMADDEDKEEKEEEFEKAEKALAAAKSLLIKAEKDNEDMDEKTEEGVEKAFSTHKKLVKALAKAKAEMPVAVKAEDAHDKEGDAEREALKEHEKEVEKATPVVATDSRIEILETTVKGLMETVAGTSKHAPLPDFVKSMVTDSIADRVDEAIESGELSDMEVMKATDILARVNAAKAGSYDGDRLATEIAKASPAVRALFATAA